MSKIHECSPFFPSCSEVMETGMHLQSEVQDNTSCLPDGESMWTEHPATPPWWAMEEHEQTGFKITEASTAQPRHAKGMETVPFARLRLRVWTLDSVSSSPCSSDFLSAMVARKRSVTESHSSGSSRSRKPRQMMQVAARRTTLKITSCFKTSTAAAGERKTGTKEGAGEQHRGGRGRNKNKLRLIT